MKLNKKRFRDCVEELSAPATTALILCLSLTVIALIRLFVGMVTDFIEDPIYVLLTYPELFEYILMSLTLTFGGAALIDITVREQG
ncbi:MAG: hypothetical protein E7640_05505 [Ruminococcaceae bacterium]|nr:hypothetical protein [Oscillospiraceae bacterium]